MTAALGTDTMGMGGPLSRKGGWPSLCYPETTHGPPFPDFTAPHLAPRGLLRCQDPALLSNSGFNLSNELCLMLEMGKSFSLGSR
jgi:hypothetical protein